MTLGLGLTPIMQTLVFPQVLADSFLDADLGFTAPVWWGEGV